MQTWPRASKPTGLILFLTVLLLLLLTASYVVVMRALLDLSQPDTSTSTARRDAAYAYVHLLMILGAAVIGFLAGKWFNGLGIAFGTLFVLVVVIAMLGVQLGTYELACQGHNDLIRHWQC